MPGTRLLCCPLAEAGRAKDFRSGPADSSSHDPGAEAPGILPHCEKRLKAGRHAAFTHVSLVLKHGQTRTQLRRLAATR
ncbi:MAG: hypothetical protein IT175_04155 [Acidobacteria bacterium]|nr:hypothetical protein [Acidobacteriota bacterium]